MAEGSDTTLTAEQTAEPAPNGLVSGIKSFAAGHGGAKAVIEYVGKRGARIVLVGADGAWGDQFADGTVPPGRRATRRGRPSRTPGSVS